MEENKVVFCSYAPEDQNSFEELRKHLEPSLIKSRAAILWGEMNVIPGGEPERVINEYLNKASIILLLVSVSSLNSPECKHHVQQAMEKHESTKTPVIPIILQHCLWDSQPFDKLLILPTGTKNGKVIASWPDPHEAWSDVARNILRTLDKLAPSPPQPPPPNIPEKKPPEGKKLFITLISVLILCALIASLVVFLKVPKTNSPQPATTPTHSALTSTTPPASTGPANASMFGFDAQHTRFNRSEHLLSLTTIHSLKLSWTAPIGTGAGVADIFFPSSPAVVNGVVYVGSWDKKLYALDASIGKVRWTAQTGDRITSSPAVVNGVVYVGSWDKKLYAFKASGCGQSSCSPLWVSAPTGNSIFSSPLVDNGTVYVGSQDGKLYAYNASSCDGNTSSCSPLWSIQLGIPTSSPPGVSSSPAVAEGIVYVGSWDGKIYAIDTTTHTIKWSYSTRNIIWSSPAIANGMVYIGSTDHKLYALDAQTGRFEWAYTTGDQIHSSPAVVSGVVYTGSDDGELYALKASTGEFLWKSTHVDAAFLSSPMVANSLIYLSGDNDTLYIYNASGCGNGLLICDPVQPPSRLSDLAPNLRLSSPTVVDGAVYLSSQDGYLYAFRLSDATS